MKRKRRKKEQEKPEKATSAKDVAPTAPVEKQMNFDQSDLPWKNFDKYQRGWVISLRVLGCT
uniref:Uncharacterized protein n=1 Tax=Nelumbo nucifera TaxID=4432 RepID=A0A822XRJ1_NELNU|nr:TPA_asm: hypothetical protein HUJ06_021551 [Nelumbo nucifera]